MKYELGQYIPRNEEVENSDQCFICGKELKETNVEVRIALTENLTLVTAEEAYNLPYGLDWSPRIGKSCLKKFPKESIIEEILV